MILSTDPVRQQGYTVTQSFPAMLAISEAVAQHTLTPSYVSSDANSRERKCNLVPLVGADTNSLGQECSGV